MDRRQIFELQQRRQVCVRINELKSNCHNLTQARDDLLNRLTKLNEVVDVLIQEKTNDKYDAEFDLDLALDRRAPRATSETNDLTIKRSNILSQHDKTSHQQVPSDAFKVKLSICLQEVIKKAEDIAKLSGRV